MSYQALARKWRPRAFDEVVGQDHAVAALSNALNSERLHHAYLFTGTRGVGKTTLARIIAKALNCETGVSATPCGQCSVCTAVDAGNFVDLLEVDAASRTKVDDTRELLDNVQYRPTQGRFKVYLIDEVHMLSGHSFNALLKTLEEPPPHVKFLLATTDPQKLPATVLSRCLQFHLRALDVEEIESQLNKILQAEEIAFENAALNVLARSADGSMRDGLSLLDQAIAYAGGDIKTAGIRTMLGLIDSHYIAALADGVVAQDPQAVMATIATMAEHSVNYTAAIDELMLLFHHTALYRQAPAALRAKSVASEDAELLAQKVNDEDLQLYYQIALVGKRDLNLAPDARSGFEMVLLRMMLFHLEQRSTKAQSTPGMLGSSRPREPAAASDLSPSVRPATSATGDKVLSAATANNVSKSSSVRSETPTAQPSLSTVPRASQNGNTSLTSPVNDTQWAELIHQAGLKGMTREFAMNCALVESNADCLKLRIDDKHAGLNTANRREALCQNLNQLLDSEVNLTVEVGECEQETPAQQQARDSAEQIQAAQQSLENDPNVQELMQRFDATLIPDSVKPG